MFAYHTSLSFHHFYRRNQARHHIATLREYIYHQCNEILRRCRMYSLRALDWYKKESMQRVSYEFICKFSAFMRIRKLSISNNLAKYLRNCACKFCKNCRWDHRINCFNVRQMLGKYKVNSIIVDKNISSKQNQLMNKII